jgi:hypothetical protein
MAHSPDWDHVCGPERAWDVETILPALILTRGWGPTHEQTCEPSRTADLEKAAPSDLGTLLCEPSFSPCLPIKAAPIHG